MIKMNEKDGAQTFNVRVQPKASSDRIMGEYNGALKIAVTTAPEGGKANRAVVKLLAKLLRVPKADIEIISGATSRNKRLKITGIRPSQIENLL